MLNDLRNVRLDAVELDDAVALIAFGKSMQEVYEHHKLVAPPWLADNLKGLRKLVDDKRRDNLERARKRIELKLEEMKSTEEKRGDLSAELARIRQELGE